MYGQKQANQAHRNGITDGILAVQHVEVVLPRSDVPCAVRGAVTVRHRHRHRRFLRPHGEVGLHEYS